MGARQSKRSVDITTTPKKGDVENVPTNEDKIEKLGDADVEVVTNGTAAHTDIEFADKEETKEAEEKSSTEVKENGLAETSDGEKTPDKEEAAVPAAGDQPTKSVEITEKAAEDGDKAVETPDAKKQKEKKKKKWSLRSISFSKKDKSKPSKDKEKNGEVEEVNEEKEEENTIAVTNAEEKTSSEVEQVTAATQETITDTTVVKEESTVENDPPKDKETSVTPAEQPCSETNIEKPVTPETSVETKKTDVIPEATTAPSVVEEIKEVRNDEIPPPLPNSNPPSQVAVFAESLKNDSLLIDANINSPITESLLDTCPTVKESSNEHLAETIKSDIISENSLSNDKSSVVIESESPIEVSESQHIDSAREDVIKSIETSTDLISSTAQDDSENKLSSPEAPAVDEKNKIESNEEVQNKISPAEDSVPVTVEALSIPDLQDNIPCNEPIVTPENNSITNLSEQQSEISNDTNIEETSILEIQNKSVPITEIEGSDSICSIPTINEEKNSVVSSAGDVPNSVDSKDSLDNNDSVLQELESNLESKDSLLPEELNVHSEESSTTIQNNMETSESSPPIVNAENVSKEVCDQPEVDSTNIGSISTSLPKETEPLCNADSLADLSTESLPSLPEPTDSVIEPMSLPPLDSVPDPLPDDNIPNSLNEPEVLLTNGNATNGMSLSPNADDDATPLPPSLDGPLKQIIVPETLVEEKSQSIEGNADTADPVHSEAQ